MAGICLLAACQASPSRTAARSPLAMPSATRAGPGPSPTFTSSPATSLVPDLPLSSVGFLCRLPVVRVNNDGVFEGKQVSEFDGGFITFPDATLRSDPAAVIHYSQQDLLTNAKPVLHGTGGTPFYDLAMKRWIPVAPAQTSPDGAFYAYSTTDPPQIHVVDVAHGSDRILRTMATQAQQIWIEDFDGRGVYFVYAGYEYQLSGLWRLDVSSGSVKMVAPLTNVERVRAGYAWVSADDPRDASPPQGPGLFDSLVRVDLATGAHTLWYYAPGQVVFLRGFDGSGQPVIYVYSPPDFKYSDIRIVTGPLEAGTEVYNGPMSLYEPQADGGRLWFWNDHGVYLFTAAAGLQKVFRFSINPASIRPVGFCL